MKRGDALTYFSHGPKRDRSTFLLWSETTTFAIVHWIVLAKEGTLVVTKQHAGRLTSDIRKELFEFSQKIRGTIEEVLDMCIDFLDWFLILLIGL